MTAWRVEVKVGVAPQREWGRREMWCSDCTLSLYVWVVHSLHPMGSVEERAGLVGVRVSRCPHTLSLSVHLVPLTTYVSVGVGGQWAGLEWCGVWARGLADGLVGLGWVGLG